MVGNIRDMRLVLGTVQEEVPVELGHRWSFDGDTTAEHLTDTAGNSTAVVEGAAVSFADGRVSLTGNGTHAGSLCLGTNCIPDTSTLEKDETDGSTLISVSRRDATTGELQRAGKMKVQNFVVSSSQGEEAVFYLGHSFFCDMGSSPDYDANATYDEVRVWRGVLSEAQLRANAIAGSGVADLTEAAVIAAERDAAADATSAPLPVGGHTATRRPPHSRRLMVLR